MTMVLSFNMFFFWEENAFPEVGELKERTFDRSWTLAAPLDYIVLH